MLPVHANLQEQQTQSILFVLSLTGVSTSTESSNTNSDSLSERCEWTDDSVIEDFAAAVEALAEADCLDAAGSESFR